ncbi:helix-turn-helix domain-containing protein [Isobaculum melis]|uniref:Transcriptional regulator, contains XRE-family HTH domain n=1 Tax=Isobaculum melis TaxID=142588 RepID=A0A1H9S0A4_9LACT|nr:helix-turn-helix transcriptional regulator [Isobaculum melis]SER78441.1 Transcriptional regulator, contains XRE-family HTH domain [Isobaculum melis]
MITNKEIGRKIKSLRIEKKLSQEELAYGICAQSQLSKMEHGETDIPIDALAKISQRLNLPLIEFLTLEMDAINQQQNYSAFPTIFIKDEQLDIAEHAAILEEELQRTFKPGRPPMSSELNLMAMIGQCYFEIEAYQKASSYFNDCCTLLLNEQKFFYHIDVAQFFIHAAKTEIKCGNYLNALDTLKNGITLTVSNDKMTAIEKLFFEKSQVEYLIGNITQADHDLLQAFYFSNLKEKWSFSSKVKKVAYELELPICKFVMK